MALALAGCATPGHDPSPAADRYLEDLAARGLFQGAVVLGREGRVTYARGFGFANAERGQPFTPDTPNDGGSIAKTFTAAAVLRLAQEGRIDLDSPVQRYLPEYPHAQARVRHLLAHGAGLPDYDWFDRFTGPPAVRGNADQLALLRAHAVAPAFVPGSAFAYDNAAYDAAALLVERVSGMPYFDFLKQAFLGPLGMEKAFLRPARLADFPGVRTIGYRRAGRDAPLHDAFEGEAFHGGGNLYLSAMDLHRWVSSFATSPPLGAATLERGLEPARLDDGRRTRLTMLSWYPSPDGGRFYYTGHHNGFYNFMYWDRDRRITAAFTSNNNLAATLGTELPRALIALAEGRPHSPLVLPEPADVGAQSVAGPWHIAGLGDVAVVLHGGRPHLRVPEGIDIRMFRMGPGVYAVPGLDGWLRFHERSGRIAVLLDSVFIVGEGARR